MLLKTTGEGPLKIGVGVVGVGLATAVCITLAVCIVVVACRASGVVTIGLARE